ncbi:hypothetical protein SAY86_005556 [Trapa natans]|uniref:Dof zinc finger protein n=1 Tax=Trapa natans TaxID=22666 RepID=A0AAN7QVK4_TRANT|nr:hypothetical protein SAY86_005556 [Trapa natans]
MVSSSIVPGYLDPPIIWQQEHIQHHLGDGNGRGGISLLQLPPQQSSPPVPTPASGQSPPCMAEKGGTIDAPHPETALKCPRCESINTKFCYYNNYSLLQPRYFCKTCRRYWTRGGSLRNVPVGGGYRKSRRSKARAGGGSQARANGSGVSTAASEGTLQLPSPAQLPNFLQPFQLQSLSNYACISEFQVGTPNGGGMPFDDQWGVHQFPFWDNLGMTQVGASGLLQQFSQNDQEAMQIQGLNLASRSYLGFSEADSHQLPWNGNNGNASTD